MLFLLPGRSARARALRGVRLETRSLRQLGPLELDGRFQKAALRSGVFAPCQALEEEREREREAPGSSAQAHHKPGPVLSARLSFFFRGL